jgi:DNA modification methylase
MRMRTTPSADPTTVTSLQDLQLDDTAPNMGTSRGRTALAHSLRHYGAGRSILIDRQGRVLAGNQVVAQAQDLDLPITVVRTTGDQLVAVQRTDLDLARDARARQLALADNRVAEINLDWDLEQLRTLAEEKFDFDGLWSDDELEQLLGAGLQGGTGGEDALTVEPPTTTIVAGDLFALGDHRMLCGNATDPDDVTRLLGDAKPLLMVTDPPYGVEYDPSWRVAAQPQARTAVGAVANDDRVNWAAAYRLFPGYVSYVWHAGLYAGEVAASLAECEFEIRAQIIWRKQHFAMSRGHYHWQHEPCWYAVKRGRSAQWRGSRTQATVWEVPNLNPLGGTRTDENTPTGHATQKPVRLFEVPILNHTKKGEPIYDPFCGSGSALIAAEKTGRRGFAMELDPRYVQATITRWETYTGKRATSLTEGAR